MSRDQAELSLSGRSNRRAVLPLIGVLLALTLSRLPAVVVITEIMYHPEGDDRELEYIELHNETPDPLDLTGYYFSAGVDFVFTERTFLDAGAYIVVCANKDKVQQKYVLQNTAGNWAAETSLDNAGESIELANPAGVVEARVRYNDRGKWPSGADGTGHSLEIVSPYSDMDDPDMWGLSARRNGSPGKVNENSGGDSPIKLNEAHLTGSPGERWVEIYNGSDADLDLSTYYLTTEAGNLARVKLPGASLLPARKWLVIKDTDVGLDFAADAAGRVFIALVDPMGSRVVDARNFELNARFPNLSEARTPDGDSLFQDGADPTPGAANKVTVNTDVVINEIMYHPIDKAKGIEFLELYNRGTEAADLTGWSIADGVRFDFPNGTSLPADGYLVVTRDPERLKSVYNLAAGMVLGPRADDAIALEKFGTFADGGERVTITDARNNIVDTVRYFDGGEWPRWADGGGSSMELIDPHQNNANAQAWDSSDEAPKSLPSLYEYKGSLSGATAGDGPEFHLVMTGPGITIVDDLKMTSRVTTLAPEQTFVKFDDSWRYFKGQTEASDPPTAWTQGSFDDAAWPEGQAVIGFGDGDEKTVLADMRKLDPEPGYACFYVRRAFDVADPASIKNFVLDIEYDDGFVAYLNGVEVASGNMRPNERSFTALAMVAKEKQKDQVDLTARKDLLVPGKNILAVQVHNATLASNDARFQAQLASGNFVVDEGPNLFKDGIFEADSYKSSWVIQGTHIRSGRTTKEAISGTGSLKLVSTGGGDNKVNRIETSNSGLTAPQVRIEYSISYLAKWVAGTPTLLTHGAYQGTSPPSYATSTRLKVPENLGTPGLINTATQRQVALTGSKNLGPVIGRVSHNPPLPAANEAVRVRARVQDSDGIESVTLKYSLDTPKLEGDALLLSVPMLDPDGDGVYTCDLPGQLVKKRVVYFIVAQDKKGQAGRWPLDHVNRANPLLLDAAAADVDDPLFAVYRHDTPFTGKPQSMRFWMHQANEAYLSSRPLHSNDLVDGTFLFQNKDVYYNSKLRFSGSPWARQAWTESYRIRMPKDNALHGSIESFNLEDHQDGGARVAKERISHYLLRWHQGQSIAPYSLQWYTQFQVNDRVNEVREFVQTPNSEFISRWWPGDSDGSFFEMDDRHVFNDAGMRQDSLDGVLLYPPYGAATLGADKEQYRYYFSLRINEEQDDFSHLINFAQLLTKSQTPDAEFDERVWDEVDVESFLRYWSIRMNTDDWDCWGTNRGKNCYIYRPSEYGKWFLLAWDMELTYGNVGAFMPPALTATSNPAYNNKFAEVTRFINRPRVKRLYYGILKEMIENQFQSTFLTPFMLKLDSVGAQQTAVGKANGFIDQRRRNLVTAVRGVTQPVIDFTVTTNGGQSLEVESTEVLIEGRAPVEVSLIRILIDGKNPATPWSWSFSDVNVLGWEAQGSLPVGAHTLEFVGLNSLEQLVDSVTFDVTVTTPGPPTITAVAPTRAIVGETVTVLGTRFRAGVKVLFGGVPATVVNLTPADTTSLTAVVPAGVALGEIELRVESAGGVQSEPFPLTILAEKRKFIRGDSDRSGKVDLTDSIYTLRFLFQGGEEPLCKDAADVDDDGFLRLTDAIVALRFLFQGGAAPPAPYPDAGDDPTNQDETDCGLGLE